MERVAACWIKIGSVHNAVAASMLVCQDSVHGEVARRINAEYILSGQEVVGFVCNVNSPRSDVFQCIGD